MEDRTPEQMIADGHAAERILNDDLFQRAVAQARTLYETDMHTGAHVAQRDLGFHRWNALNDVLMDLETIMKYGQALSQQRQQEHQRKSLDRVFRMTG